MKLSKLIPECNTPDTNVNGAAKNAQSKGGILAKACEYLAEMRNTNQRAMDSIKQAENVSAENERLSSQLEQLQVWQSYFIPLNNFQFLSARECSP